MEVSLPGSTGIRAAIPTSGVDCHFPPIGNKTEAEPIEPSKHSESPLCPATEKSPKTESHLSFRLSPPSSFIPSEEEGQPVYFQEPAGCPMTASASLSAPAVSKNALSRSTMVFPRHLMTSLFVSVTRAITAPPRFSSATAAKKASQSDARTTTAILSCDSETASSVPLSPAYFFGTASRSISSPGVSSPTATATPPAPKSLHLRIIPAAVLLRKRRCSFRSSTAFPFWTSAPAVVTDFSV